MTARKEKDEKEEKVDGVERDTHVVMQGKQPVFSSNDESLCEAFANDLRMKSINTRRDIRAPEHAISVVAL
jgi:hypothetical protein